MPENTSGDIDFRAVIGVLEERMNQLAEQIKTSPSNGTVGANANGRKRGKRDQNWCFSKKYTKQTCPGRCNNRGYGGYALQ